MGELFKNELLKIRYNKTIWLFWGVSAAFVALFGMLNSEKDLVMNLYGYTSSFAYLRIAGTFVVMFLAPVAGTVFTQELWQGTMQNTLSCGVGRLRYFAVKAVCVYVIDLLIFLFCLGEFICFRTAVRGWRPGTYSDAYPNFGLVNLAFHGGTCLLLCVYIALFILVAVSVKRPALVYFSGAVATMGEFMVMNYGQGYQGVMPAVIRMYDMAVAGKVLTPEFAGLFVQGTAMGIVFLGAAVFVFLRRDID